MSAAGKINQKEYLKKYLSGDVSGQQKKKKKKKEKLPAKATVTIVDDDIDLSQLANATEEDLENYNLGEDLPQIAGIVDERSADVIAKEDYGTNTKWKTIGSDRNAEVAKQTAKKYSCDDSADASPPRRPNRTQRSPDASPPRRNNRGRDTSPPRRKRSPDLSPPRRKRSPDNSPPRRQQSNRDSSPPRRKQSRFDASPPRRRMSRDASPPRRKRSPDLSPPRRKRSSDASPPRRKKSRFDASPPKQRSSRDTSPPRRRRSPDLSPPRRKRSPDTSPPRRNRNRSPDSPPKRVKRNEGSPSGSTSPKRIKHSPDSSPPRKANSKMMETLEGKKAGLQNAVALREENAQIRRREDDMFRKMAEKQNHDEGNTVRDRKTGRRAKYHRDSEKDREQQKRDAERKEVYDRWGAGLKQIEEYKERVATESHEMSKPVARYAGDDDLEEYLRNQCRDGDPMAKYMQKKSSENQTGPRKPIYQGSFPENRYSIRPGYRWDGVDRSNGYEKKWFDQINQKKANEEEAYKYSVEDM